jgi:hypothetical protein
MERTEGGSAVTTEGPDPTRAEGVGPEPTSPFGQRVSERKQVAADSKATPPYLTRVWFVPLSFTIAIVCSWEVSATEGAGQRPART